MSDAWLVLENGAAFLGRSVGAEGETFGELVFNTAMSGYQEILTDPSYTGQLVSMTYPHIGNYGVNGEDMESRRPWVEGFIMRQLSPVASNFRSQETLDSYLKRHKIVAMDAIDTRALTLLLRQAGAMKAGISTTEKDPKVLWKRVQASAGIGGKDLVREVTCEAAYNWANTETLGAQARAHIAVMDFGVKHNILRQLALEGCRVTVFPAATPVTDVLACHPDGVLLSNGPGDPVMVSYAIETIRSLIGHVPILGICLGHQLLGLALGGKTFKLKFGHHGANHPVLNVATGKVEITSQNHNYAIELETMPDKEIVITHKNLNDGTVEGFAHKTLPVFGIQYHPEAAPGPHDSRYLFEQFLDRIDGVVA